MGDRISKEGFDSLLFNKMLQDKTQEEIRDIVNNINEHNFFPYIDHIYNIFFSNTTNNPIYFQKYRNMVAVLCMMKEKSNNDGLAGLMLASLENSGFDIDLNNLFSIVSTGKHKRNNASTQKDFEKIITPESIEMFKEKLEEYKRISKTQSWREYILDREKQEKEVEQALCR